MINPSRSIRGRIGLDAVAEIEESDVGTIAHFEKYVNVGAVLAGAGDVVGLNHVNQWKLEQIFIEMTGFLRIATAPSKMMQALNRRHFLLSNHGEVSSHLLL